MKLAIFCKTFRDDFKYLDNMIRSFEVFVEEDVDLLLSMPAEDVSLGKRSLPLSKRCRIVADEDYVDQKASLIGGWMQQQVCKLSIFRACEYTACLIVDSDTYFIRPVSPADFFGTDGRLKMVASSISTVYTPHNADLLKFIGDGVAKKVTFASAQAGAALDMTVLLDRNSREPNTNAETRASWIYEFFGVDPCISFMPSQIFDTASLREFYKDLCVPLDLNISDLISIAPWEYIWYGCWSLWRDKDRCENIVSPAIHFATSADVIAAKQYGFTESTFAGRFLAIAMAARHFDELRF